MPTAQYRTYKSYAGIVVRGTQLMGVPAADAPHMVWASHLLSKMEAAFWGTVQSYDGAGMSAGPLHAIAVSPSSKAQGSLWSLIAMIFAHVPLHTDSAVDSLRSFLGRRGWQLTLDGILVYKADGKKVPGEEIRTWLSGPNGFVPTDGPVYDEAVRVAVMFNRVFSSPSTFTAQQMYTAHWLLSGQRETEMAAYTKYSKVGVTRANMSNYLSFASQEDLGVEFDLAMSVYHAFSVNAPAPAVDELKKAMVEKEAGPFARRLIRGLGKRKFGKWQDTPDDKNRYDKTRIACQTLSQRWSSGVVNALMPVNL